MRNKPLPVCTLTHTHTHTNTHAEARFVYSDAVEYGVLPGHSLVMLEKVLHDVYLPMVDPERTEMKHSGSAWGAQSQFWGAVSQAPSASQAPEVKVRRSREGRGHRTLCGACGFCGVSVVSVVYLWRICGVP